MYISYLLKCNLFFIYPPFPHERARMCRVRVGYVMLRGVKPLDSSQEILFNVLFFNMFSFKQRIFLLHLLLFLHCEPQSDRGATQLTRVLTESRHLRTKTERRTFIALISQTFDTVNISYTNYSSLSAGDRSYDLSLIQHSDSL